MILGVHENLQQITITHTMTTTFQLNGNSLTATQIQQEANKTAASSISHLRKKKKLYMLYRNPQIHFDIQSRGWVLYHQLSYAKQYVSYIRAGAKKRPFSLYGLHLSIIHEFIYNKQIGKKSNIFYISLYILHTLYVHFENPRVFTITSGGATCSNICTKQFTWYRYHNEKVTELMLCT